MPEWWDDLKNAPSYFGNKIMGEHGWKPSPATIGPTQRAGIDEARLRARGVGEYQSEVANAVRQRALGEGGPSVAELQMRRGLGQAQQAAGQQAASARGLGRAGAGRAAVRAGADLASQANEQGAMLRAQEQIGAQQLAGQQYRDMRQQELLDLGYSLEEAKALLAAETSAQQTRAQVEEGMATRGQGPAAMVGGALGGLIASDARAKEIVYAGVPMSSDFTSKEIAPARSPMIMQRPGAPMPGETVALPAQQSGPSVAMLPYLQVQDSPLSGDVEKQQEKLSAFEIGQQAARASSGGNVGDAARSGFAIGSLLSDFTSKELMRGGSRLRAAGDRAALMATRADGEDWKRIALYERARRESMSDPRLKQLPSVPAPGYPAPPVRAPGYRPTGLAPGLMMSDFTSKELDALSKSTLGRTVSPEQSREDLGPVQPVTYRYKPEHAARMAGEQTQLADIRARYAGLGGVEPEEAAAIEEGTYRDKRALRPGIVAQQLQQSPAFRDSVVSTPAGLAVEKDRAMSTALGELAGLDKRIAALEGKRGAKGKRAA